jgi:hypothetical protein
MRRTDRIKLYGNDDSSVETVNDVGKEVTKLS